MKYLAFGFIVLIFAWVIYTVANSGFFETASVPTLLASITALLLTGYGVYRGFKNLILLALPIMLSSCHYAKSNQQVLVSDDCGSNWEMIEAGKAVPRGTVNPCYMKVVIPNFPMQGEAKYTVNMKDQVKVVVEIDYDYSITDPLAFIKQAKYLGRANEDPDSESSLNTNAFEQAENNVIDKRMKDVSKDIFLRQDIVEMDQNSLEDTLLSNVNERLAKLGVRLNFITLTFLLDDQTNAAIDVATAMKIYQSRSLEEVGKSVITARAGATKINMNVEQPKVVEE